MVDEKVFLTKGFKINIELEFDGTSLSFHALLSLKVEQTQDRLCLLFYFTKRYFYNQGNANKCYSGR